MTDNPNDPTPNSTSRILLPPPAIRPLHAGGPNVSALAWGMWRFAGQPIATATALVHAALDAGINFLDTADIYGADTAEGFGSAETLLGQILAADPALRSRMVLATKGGIIISVPYDSSSEYQRSAIDISLKRLNTDRVDLWQIHRPDILTHPQEIARTLEDAYKAGKIGAIGVSNFSQPQIDALQHFLTIPIATTQPECSPLHLDPIVDGQFDQAMRMGIIPMAWSPLGGGRIAAPTVEREIAVAEALEAVARKFGVSRTAAAYSWIMAHPAHPIPIVGTQNLARIAEAVDAHKIQWTRTDWYDVMVASRGERLP
jgi:predicted oxidoreductase